MVFQDTKHALRLWNIQYVYLLEKSHKWPRHCSIPDIALPNVRLHHLGTGATWLFDHYFVLNVFTVWYWSLMVGFLFPAPQHVGLKRFREFRNSSVLWFDFLCGGFHSFTLPQEEWPVSHSPGMRKTANSSFRKVKEGESPSVTVKGRVIQYLRISRNFAFLWCLSNGSSHFY